MAATTKPHSNVLPNLDALRFFAFLGVMLAHAFDSIRPKEPSETLREFYEAMDYGVIGVNFFFVLSGFLITRILLDDFEVAGRLRAGRFYVRRILRIWPLYFFMLLLAQVYYHVLHVTDTNTHWWYFFLFLGNYHVIFEGYPATSALGHLWSIAVEEQFYFVWPLLLCICRKRPVVLCVAVIVVSLLFRYWAVVTHHAHFQLYFNSLSVMNDIAIGALLACLTQRLNANSVSVSTTKVAIGFVLLLVVAYVFEVMPLARPLVPWSRLMLSLLFVGLVFHQVFVKNRVVNVEAIPGIGYLGKISYGLYIYHAFTALGTRYLFDKLSVSPLGWHGVTIYPLAVLAVTVVVSALSYELVEKRILRLKSVLAR